MPCKARLEILYGVYCAVMFCFGSFGLGDRCNSSQDRKKAGRFTSSLSSACSRSLGGVRVVGRSIWNARRKNLRIESHKLFDVLPLMLGLGGLIASWRK